MSQQQRKKKTSSRAPQSGNERDDNLFEPRQMGAVPPNRQSKTGASTTSNQQQSAGSNQPPVSNKQSAKGQLPDGEVTMAAEIEVQIGSQITVNLLDNLMKAGIKRNNTIVEGTIQKGVRVLRSKIRKVEAEVETQPEIFNSMKEIEEEAHEKWRLCEEMRHILRGDHAEGLRNMNSSLEMAEQIHNSVEEEIKEGENREKLFAQRRALFEQDLDKITAMVDFETKIRDNICIEISEMNTTESGILPIIDNFRQSNKLFKKEIGLIKAAIESHYNMTSEVAANASKCTSDKEATIVTLESVRSHLKKEKKKLIDSLKTEQAENEGIRNEIDRIIEQSRVREEELDEEENSNQLLNETSETVYEQQRSSFCQDLEKTASDINLLQFEMDKKQRAYDELKQLLEEISSKKEEIHELEEKIDHLQKEQWKQAHKVAVMEEYINEAIQQQNENGFTVSVYSPKRQKLPSSHSMDEDNLQGLQDSSQSSYDLRDLMSITNAFSQSTIYGSNAQEPRRSVI